MGHQVTAAFLTFGLACAFLFGVAALVITVYLAVEFTLWALKS